MTKFQAELITAGINCIIATFPTHLVVNNEDAAMELSELYLNAGNGGGPITGPFLWNGELPVWHVKK